MVTMDELLLSNEEALYIRVAQLEVLSRDIGSSPVKRGHAQEVRRSVLNQLGAVAPEEMRANLEKVAIVDAAKATQPILKLLGPMVRELVHPLIALEVYVGATVPPGEKWKFDRLSLVTSVMDPTGADYDKSDIQEIAKMYSRALKRLAGDAVSPALRLALLGGTAVVTLLAAPAAAALGSAIGGAMGLSGAAATSAGLAWLGGGSLAAGGFGMAGGTALVMVTARAASYGGRRLAVTLARSSAAVTVIEVAKLDFTCAVYPSAQEAAVAGLIELLQELQEDDGSHESRKSARAIQAEVRYLTDSRHQRVLRKGTRVLPVNLLNKWIDGPKNR